MYVFRNFEASAAVMGLHTNWHKTKMQNMATRLATRSIYIDDQAAELTYLIYDTDSYGYCYPRIQRRLGIAGYITAPLDKVWHQQRLTLYTKLRIYTSLVQSIVLYGSET